MVKGKLQPALKYVAPQPYINKYKIRSSSLEDEKIGVQEVLTYPSHNGDINVNRQHNAYVDAL